MLCGFTPFWDGGSPVKIYENILKGRVKYPPYIHHDAQDLLVQLITADLTKRLGNLHGGSHDVKNHPWFAEVTWERLVKKDIDAPYVPPVKGGAGDASQFDKYPEETEEYGKKGDDPYVLFSPTVAVSNANMHQIWTLFHRLLIDQSLGLAVAGGRMLELTVDAEGIYLHGTLATHGAAESPTKGRCSLEILPIELRGNLCRM